MHKRIQIQIYNTRISGPYGPQILAPALGLVLLASLAKGEHTNGRTNIALYLYRYTFSILPSCCSHCHRCCSRSPPPPSPPPSPPHLPAIPLPPPTSPFPSPHPP